MIPPKILAALNHVKQFYPSVCMVAFDEDTRWQYMDKNFRAPVFGDEISVSILEDAVYDLNELPAVFQLCEE